MKKALLLAPLLLAAAVLAAAQWGAFSGRRPQDLGVHDGRLAPPAQTPNSVSSQAVNWADHPQQRAAQVAPLALRGTGEQTIAALARLVATRPGTTVIESRADYLRVEFQTRWMHFVDDCEFWFDPAAGVIQVRSASRLGHSDMGVNRARIESIRQQLHQPGAP